MTNIVATFFVVLILGSAIFYIVRNSKKGIKCIGCPSGAKCKNSKYECNGNCKNESFENSKAINIKSEKIQIQKNEN